MHGLAIVRPTVSAIFATAMREAVQNNINYPLTQLSLMDGSHCQNLIRIDSTARENILPWLYLALSSIYTHMYI